jgi:hypothetical protein
VRIYSKNKKPDYIDDCSLLPNLGGERDGVLATETLDDTARFGRAALVSRELKGALPEAANKFKSQAI